MSAAPHQRRARVFEGFGSRLCKNTAEQFRSCGLKQYDSIVDFHDRQPLFGRGPSNSNSWAHS